MPRNASRTLAERSLRPARRRRRHSRTVCGVRRRRRAGSRSRSSSAPTSAAACRSIINARSTAACARWSRRDVGKGTPADRASAAPGRAIAPHLLRPLPFLIGTYRFTKRSRLARDARASRLYDLVGRASQSRRVARTASAEGEARVGGRDAASVSRASPRTDCLAARSGTTTRSRHPDRLNWTVALAAGRGRRASSPTTSRPSGRCATAQRVAGRARARRRRPGAKHDLQAQRHAARCRQRPAGDDARRSA